MYIKALDRFNSKIQKASTWEEFMTFLNSKNVVLTPWCENNECEQKVKERSGIESKEMAGDGELQLTGQAKTLCIPLGQDPLAAG